MIVWRRFTSGAYYSPCRRKFRIEFAENEPHRKESVLGGISVKPEEQKIDA